MNFEQGFYLRAGLEAIPICFLDFDGVLHPDAAYHVAGHGIQMLAAGHQLFEWASILEDLLLPHPEIRIVLSTSWVPMRSFRFAKLCLPDELQKRVIGATYHSRAMSKREFLLYPRGEQIRQYVVRHQLRRWCAIDDDDQGWPTNYLPKIVLTDENSGLNNKFVQDEIRRILRYL